MDYTSIKSYFTVKQDQGEKCKAICPSHKDKEASLCISYDSIEGKTILYCQAGCDTKDVLDRVGLKFSDLFDKSQISSSGTSGKSLKIVATYKYRDAAGKVLFEKVRFHPKKFTQKRVVNGAVVWGLDGGSYYETFPGSNSWSKKKDSKKTQEVRFFEKQEPVIYNLPEVIEAVKQEKDVYIVEGEKDADNLTNIGLTATCNFDGASKNTQKQKWKKEYNQYFKGANIILIPDNDNSGRAHMEYIAENLQGIANGIKIVELIVPNKGDTSDWLEEGHTKDELINIVNNTSNYSTTKKSSEISLINYNFSDVGNAERLIAIHGSNIRFSHIRNKFFIWDGRHWKTDNLEYVSKLAKSVLRRLQAEGDEIDAKESEESEKLKKQVLSFVLKSESDGRIKAMVNQVRSQPETIMQETDKDIFILNLRNGSLNLKTGELREHRRQDNITKLVDIEYKAKAQCPNWEKFLDKIFLGEKELIEYVQKTIGYSLTGSISEQCFYMLYGGGANGKSTFLNAVERILGDYADSLKGSSLMVKRNDDGARGDLAKLVGKRFIIASELNEGQTFDESLIKAITGGDVVPVRFLYGEEFPLRAQLKLWIGTNEKPKIKGSNFGIWRRVRLIPFLYTFKDEEKDEDFFEKYIEPELPGILNWAIEGCLMWQKYGIQTPEKVMAAVDDYRSEMDQIQRFIDDCCITGDKYTAKLTDMYDAYVKWCTDTREHELSSVKFGKKLKEKGFEQVRSSFARFWDGIGIVDSDRKDYEEIKDKSWPFNKGEQIQMDKE